CQQLVEYPLTF
nr:immunoglobulin light chain junction region [Mus musculus]NSL98368.1 immunoglobulin light chain junction region [Mus musculus]